MNNLNTVFPQENNWEDSVDRPKQQKATDPVERVQWSHQSFHRQRLELFCADMTTKLIKPVTVNIAGPSSNHFRCKVLVLVKNDLIDKNVIYWTHPYLLGDAVYNPEHKTCTSPDSIASCSWPAHGRNIYSSCLYSCLRSISEILHSVDFIINSSFIEQSSMRNCI